ncbi:MAG: HAD family hydrolase [Campylobacterota bacterium]
MTVVIFDMDGTLIDSQNDITASINHVRALNHTLEPLSSDFVVEAINRDQRNLAMEFYNTELYQDADRILFEAHYHKQCTEAVVLYDGVKELIETLHERGVKMGVATNAPSPFANRMLEHVGVSHYFEQIIGADMVALPKPDPEMLRVTLEHTLFDTRIDKALMVGDNSKDMEAAFRAGVTSVFATWGFSPEGHGDHVIGHPRELLELI